MKRFGSQARRTPPAEQCACAAGRPGADREGFLRQAVRAQPRRDLLRPDQFRASAVASGRPRREGLQDGAVQQAARPIGADRLSDRFRRACLYSRWSTKWSVVGSIAVMLAGLLGVFALELRLVASPVLPVALDHRHQRADRDAAALCGGELPAAHPRADHRHGRGLHEGGRDVRAIPRHSRAGAAARNRLDRHLVPTVAALALVAWFGKETRGRDLRDLDPDGHTFAATGI